MLSRLLWERIAISGVVMAAGTLALFLAHPHTGDDLERAFVRRSRLVELFEPLETVREVVERDGELRVIGAECLFEDRDRAPRQLGGLFVLAEAGVSLRQAGRGEAEGRVVGTDVGFLER